MTKAERNAIIKRYDVLTNEQLEEAYYKSVYECLGSQAEEMYERGYDIADIEEREEYEDYLCDKSDVLEMMCEQRGIRLWQ